MRLTFHAEADDEVTDAVKYYERQLEDLGFAFLDELDATLKRLRVYPESSPLVGKEIRQAVLNRFPYSVFYVIESDRIRVIAVGHQSRRPFYWRDRL